MVKLGYLLITAGFLAGAYFAVLQVEGVPWGAWALAIAFGVVGVALARLGKRQSATSEGRLEGIDALVAQGEERVAEVKAGGAVFHVEPHEVAHLVAGLRLDHLDGDLVLGCTLGKCGITRRQ